MQINEDDLKYDFAILIPGSNFNKAFISSLAETFVWLMQNNYTFIYRIWSFSILPDLRNSLLGAEKENSKEISTELFAGQYSVKKIILIDSDTSWEVGDFAAIALSPHDITTGLLTVGNKSYNVYKRVVGQEPFGYYQAYKYYEVPENDFFEVDACGAGFMSINADVFKKIKFPWFEFKQVVNENSNRQPRMIGEDFYFCEKIKDAGYKIYANTMVKPGHIKEEPKYLI